MAITSATSTSAKLQFEFRWEGKDKYVKRVKGTTMAADESALRSDLKKQSIMLLRANKKRQGLNLGGRVTPADVAIFARQLSTMLAAGIPMVQSFDIVASGVEKPALRDMILRIKGDVESGSALYEALRSHPLQFDDLFVNLVRAGEQAGALDTLLDKIATYKEKSEATKKKVKKALYYPAAVIGVAAIVTTVLMIFVIPEFQKLFKGFGANLPAFTQMVINISNALRHHGIWIALALGAIVGTFLYFKKRSRKLRELLDRISLKLPIIGPILTKAIISRYTRTLSTMFAAGVPLVEALESVAGATGNIVYEDAVMRMRTEVAGGQRLQKAMEAQNLFPNMVVQMIAVGEEAGSLDTMASKVATFYEEEVDNAVDSMSSLLEPLIMVVLGVIVGGLVIAMYLPIFQLGNVVG